MNPFKIDDIIRVKNETDLYRVISINGNSVTAEFNTNDFIEGNYEEFELSYEYKFNNKLNSLLSETE